jgi:hypothetical protein
MSWKKLLSTIEIGDLPNDIPKSKIESAGAWLAADIPNLDAAKITAGSFNTARIPNLDAAKIASGVLGDSRIPSLAANKITSGEFPAARIANGAIKTVKIDIDDDLDMGLNQVENFVLECVTTLPTITQEAANDGRVVRLTQQDGVNKPGLYMFEYAS